MQGMDDCLKGDPIVPDHHVLRHCRRDDLQCEADGSISGVFPDAFVPDEDGLSVTWVEHFPGGWTAQIAAAKDAMSRRRMVRASNRLAVLSVERILRISDQLGKHLAVIHDPDETEGKENPGHSLITGYSEDDADVTNLLITTCVGFEA